MHRVYLLGEEGGQGSGQQVLQRRVVQVVGGDDVIQVLQVAPLVSHEVGDSGPREDHQRTQHLHVFKRHLNEEKSSTPDLQQQVL